jgi:hypothetical protein
MYDKYSDRIGKIPQISTEFGIKNKKNRERERTYTYKRRAEWAMLPKRGRLLRTFKIKTDNILDMNSSHILKPVKDDLGLKVSEVYSIPRECGKAYIG